MWKKLCLGVTLAFLMLFLVVWLLGINDTKTTDEEFTLVLLENDEVLICEIDVLSYNWTSQEIAITNAASERLLGQEEGLYSFTGGFVVRIHSEEIYRGVFRSAIHSAIPDSPGISVLFPSILFSSETENYCAMRMFYPSFEPPTSQQNANEKLFQYFEEAGKLIY
jgi:hypothetical protein